ncbi:hypothetical protein AB1A81_17285 [Bdellovibrio bacteriovorus]|nr:hypothetical protein [Bdellovibrio bacteriovorus]
MKSALIIAAMVFASSSAMAAEIQCHWDGEKHACPTAYDLFVSDSVCFIGDADKAAQLFGKEVAEDSSLRYLEIQVTNANRILVFVSDEGVERLIRVNRCE